jgi:hypothetical protein
MTPLSVGSNIWLLPECDGTDPNLQEWMTGDEILAFLSLY